MSGFITTWILKGRLPFRSRLIEGTHKSTTLKTRASVFVKMLSIFVITVLRVLFTESIFVLRVSIFVLRLSFTMSIFVPSVSFTPTNRLSTRVQVRKMLVAQVNRHADTERIILVSTPPGTTSQMAAKSFASKSPSAFPGPSSGPKPLMLALGGVGGAGGGGGVDDAPLSCGYTRSCRTRAAGMGPRAVARGGIRRYPIEMAWEEATLSTACGGSRTHAQGADPSVMEALGARNDQLPLRWSLLTTPLRNPMCGNRSVREPRVLRESGWAYRAAVAPPICTKPLRRRFRSFSCRHRISF